MHIKTKHSLALGLILIFSTGASSQAVVADYGIPLAVGTVVEAIKDLAGNNICGGGFFCQWALGLVNLQNNNIQNGFSKHLQEKVASGTQTLYNDAFTPLKTEAASGFHASMELFRSASLKAQSTESIKSRMTMSQWLPVMNALFDLGTERSTAYAVFLYGTFFPEYNAKDSEIYSQPHGLFVDKKISVTKVLAELERYKLWTESEPTLQRRLERIVEVWESGEGDTDSLSSKESSNRAMGIAVAAALVTPGFAGFKSNPLLETFVRTLNENLAESLTRSKTLDLAANMRRKVQRFGMPAINLTSTSYELHQKRQFEVTQIWSELGMTMRTNIWRYLAIIVPQLVQILREPNIQNRAAMLASTLSYIRQYDPEYSVEDRFMRMSLEAIFGGYDFFTPEFKEAFEGNLRWLDPGFLSFPEVRSYYEFVLGPAELVPVSLRSEGFWSNTIEVVKSTGLPIFSFGLSWLAEGVNTGLKMLFANKLPVFFIETYDKLLGAVIRGVAEPVKNDIQQSINDATRAGAKSNAEIQLSGGYVQMNGRLGPDAQMARAIYERLLPTFSHVLDAAREAYQADEIERSAAIIVYLSELMATVYPEALADDSLIAKLIQVRFSQFTERSAFEPVLLKTLPFDKPILACVVQQRLFYAQLLSQNGIEEATYDWSWSGVGFQAAYRGVTGLTFAFPGLVKAYAPSKFNNRGLTWVYSAVKNVAVVSIFNGISKGLMDGTKSYAQRWAQYPFIDSRVDESENWGKAQRLFGSRQLNLQAYLNGNAQEGRKDLIVILGNWALNFRKAHLDYETFEEFMNTPLGQHYSEAQEVLRPYFEGMKGAMRAK